MFGWLKKKACSHEFPVSDIKMTGIAELEPPKNGSYEDWVKYYENYYNCEGVTRRVSCKCRKCGNIFFADCGLHLTGKLV